MGDQIHLDDSRRILKVRRESSPPYPTLQFVIFAVIIFCKLPPQRHPACGERSSAYPYKNGGWKKNLQPPDCRTCLVYVLYAKQYIVCPAIVQASQKDLPELGVPGSGFRVPDVSICIDTRLSWHK